MKAIYRPKGKAAEYAPLALNIYTGCSFGCKYCYAPASMRRSYERYTTEIEPRKDILSKVAYDCKQLAGSSEMVQLSFIGDPYQPMDENLMFTREIIKLIGEHGIPFSILTKAGKAARRDFDLLKKYDGMFGVSAVWWHDHFGREFWEPGASRIPHRVFSLNLAKKEGITTWVSMEPVIDPREALKLIDMIHPWVDHWKIGKINHNRALEVAVDWIAFREEVQAKLDGLGADYYLKKSLTEL